MDPLVDAATRRKPRGEPGAAHPVRGDAGSQGRADRPAGSRITRPGARRRAYKGSGAFPSANARPWAISLPWFQLSCQRLQAYGRERWGLGPRAVAGVRHLRNDPFTGSCSGPFRIPNSAAESTGLRTSRERNGQLTSQTLGGWLKTETVDEDGGDVRDGPRGPDRGTGRQSGSTVRTSRGEASRHGSAPEPLLAPAADAAGAQGCPDGERAKKHEHCKARC